MSQLFRSESVGGAARSGRGKDALASGTLPDFRLTINDKPLGAITSRLDIAQKNASVTYQKDVYVDTNGYEIEFLISGIGSSTLVDTDGDIFHESAIRSMAADSIDLNVLLNHVPTAPWNIAGSVLEAEVDFLVMPDGEKHTVLKLLTDIEPKHADAWRTYEMIAGIDCRPRKLGFSVGCLYADATPRQTKSGIYRGADVWDVLPVEFSIVTMPANRLAWIETIAKDMQTKGMIPVTDTYRRKGVCAEYALERPVVEAITDWMDFGPVDGPKLEKLAREFEQRYGIIYATRPRSR